MTALDLCRPHYQVLLIIYLKFTAKSVEDVKKEKNKSVCDFIGLKNNKLHYKCNKCKKNIKKFPNTYKFCNRDINKIVLLLWKGVCLYEYMGSWERFDGTSLHDKKAFYSELYLGDITDEDYIHAQNVFETFKLKKLGDHHDLYVQSDTLLLADVFENFRN